MNSQERVFIIYYDYSLTSENHAGMVHLVKLIKHAYPGVRLIKSIPHEYKTGRYIAKVYAILMAFFFRLVLKKSDKVFFFEYLTNGTAFQALTAKTMRLLKIKSPVYALIHLSGQHLLEAYHSKKNILKKLQPVDKIFVFGSILNLFLKSTGFKKDIITTFHYVDTDYYKPGKAKLSANRLQVICIGELRRDFSLLKQVISRLPNVTFHILMGKLNLNPIFGSMVNVKLYPFITENEMLRLMQACDVSLSVLEDTIGSNVITTSMAVGLVQVVSDVGSIRDYCNDSNSFLCTEEQDYIAAITQLDSDRLLLQKMKEANLRKAATISHEVFISQFKELI